MGVPARISKGDPLGRYRGTIVRVTDGRPIVRNSHLWGRRRPVGPSNTEMDRRPMGHPTPVSRNLDRGMQPAKDIRSVPGGNRNARTRGVQEPIVTPLSPLAESFTPRPTSEERQTQPPHMDNDLGPLPRLV